MCSNNKKVKVVDTDTESGKQPLGMDRIVVESFIKRATSRTLEIILLIQMLSSFELQSSHLLRYSFPRFTSQHHESRIQSTANHVKNNRLQK